MNTPTSALAAIVAEYRQQQPGRKLTPFPTDAVLLVGQEFGIHLQKPGMIRDPQPCLCDRCKTPIVIDGKSLAEVKSVPRLTGKRIEKICLECYAFTDSQFNRRNVNRKEPQ